MRETGEINRLTKKEGLLIGREIERLLIRLSGVRTMKRLPDLVFIIDVGREEAGVHEANLLKVPIVAMVDTNCNPQNIDYVIPSNDDAIRAIKLLVARVADAVLEGKAMRKEEEPETEAPVAVEKSADAKPAKSRKGQRVVEAADVDEVGEVDLLGASTLAKLNVTRKVVEPGEIAPVEGLEAAAPAEEPKAGTVVEEKPKAKPRGKPKPALSEAEATGNEAGAQESPASEEPAA
jgi:small subunit ribosomal protein S2